MPRPKKDSSVNGNKPWGPIVEIRAEEIALPARTTGAWFDLWQDLLLRLEKTEREFALAIPFENHQVGENAAAALRKYAESHKMADQVEILSRKAGEGRTIYVRRGEAYGRHVSPRRPDEEDAL